MANAMRERINGTSPQDVMKINENFEAMWYKVHGDLDYTDTNDDTQRRINTQWITVQDNGNFDNNYPLDIRFFIPPNTTKIKSSSFNAIVTNYRMDSSVTSSGGGVADGQVNIGIGSGGGGTSSVSTNATTSYVKKWGTPPYEYIAPTDYIYPKYENMKTKLGGFLTSNDSRNTLGILTPEGTVENSQYGIIRYADFYGFQHSHEIPAHSHDVYFAPHSHNGNAMITIPNHSHPLNEGIKVSTKPVQNCEISINGQQIAILNASIPNMNSIDISSALKIGEWNTIRCISTSIARIELYGVVEILIK